MDIESIIKKREFENKVSAFLRFMQTKTGIEVAEYATHLQDTIDGLTESKEEFVIAYKELLDKNHELRGLLINLLINESKDSDSLIQEWVGATIIKIKSAIPGAAGNSPAEDGSPNKRMSAIDENNIMESSTASC